MTASMSSAPRAHTTSRALFRFARILTIALVVGVGLSQVLLTIGDWHLRDADAYWNAALRLRAGEPLYPPISDPEASDVYRYAPWFAWAWVPLTYLPHAVVQVAWSLVLLGASALALAPLIRARAWLLVAFFGFVLVGISGIGNVQPLLVAGLVWGLERRSGPVMIALAASLKVVPILFVATYLGRRQWKRAALTVVATAALVGPMLLHDLTHYPVSSGAGAGLIGIPVIYGAVIAIGIAVSARLARSRLAWLAAATTVGLAVPRLFVYDVSFLAASLPASNQLRRAADDST